MSITDKIILALGGIPKDHHRKAMRTTAAAVEMAVENQAPQRKRCVTIERTANDKPYINLFGTELHVVIWRLLVDGVTVSTHKEFHPWEASPVARMLLSPEAPSNMVMARERLNGREEAS